MNEIEPWADTKAAAVHFNKAEWTVRELAKSGALGPGATKIGSEWRFKLSLIDAHLTAKPDPWAQSPRSRGRKRVA